MTTTTHAINRARQSIQLAIEALQQALERHRAGRGQESSLEQLTAFRETLMLMKEDLNSGCQGTVQAGMGRVVADSWSLHSELGNAVAKAEQDYRAVVET